jgi:2-polyprenyl-3-methyl-5-hydroxy-6-metoxy-1,4-benzoquinol methylase
MKDAAFDYDQMWTQYWGDVQRYGPSHRTHRRFLFRILRHLEFKSALEVGCGSGLNLFTIRQAFPDATLAGIDIAGAALAQLSDVLPDIPTYRLDITKDKLAAKYDLVFSFDVVEHIRDDVTALRNMCEMSRRYVLVSTVQGRMRDFEKDIGHVRNYRRGELQEKMESIGLVVLKTIEFGWPFYSPLFRDVLSRCGGQKHTYGSYSPIKKLVCRLLYALFLLNSKRSGDMLFVLGEKQ